MKLTYVSYIERFFVYGRVYLTFAWLLVAPGRLYLNSYSSGNILQCNFCSPNRIHRSIYLESSVADPCKFSDVVESIPEYNQTKKTTEPNRRPCLKNKIKTLINICPKFVYFFCSDAQGYKILFKRFDKQPQKIPTSNLVFRVLSGWR